MPGILSISTAGTGGGSNTISVTIPGTRIGNTLVVGIAGSNSNGPPVPTVTSVSDNKVGGSSVYAAVSGATASDTQKHNAAVYAVANIAAGITSVSTVLTAGVADAVDIWVYELTGMPLVLNVNTSGNSSSQIATNSPLGPVLTTTKLNTFILQVIGCNGQITSVDPPFFRDVQIGPVAAHVLNAVQGSYQAQFHANLTTIYAVAGAAFTGLETDIFPDDMTPGSEVVWKVI